MKQAENSESGTISGSEIVLREESDLVAELMSQLPIARRPDEHPALVYLSSLESEESVRTMKMALKTFVGIFDEEMAQSESKAPWLLFPWEKIRYQHMQLARARLVAKKYSPAHANKILTAAKRVLKEAWRLGIIEHESYMRTCDVKRVKGSRVLSGRLLSQEEIQKLRVALDVGTVAGHRNWALVFTLWGGGFRRKEVAGMDVGSIDRGNLSITVIGKRNKQRTVLVSKELLSAIDEWLKIRGTDDGPLFMPVTSGGNVLRRRMSPQTIYMFMYRVIEKFGLKDFSPHDFRRTFISEMIDQSGDISSVAKLVGHDDINTTKLYDLRDEKAQRRMVDGRKMSNT